MAPKLNEIQSLEYFFSLERRGGNSRFIGHWHFQDFRLQREREKKSKYFCFVKDFFIIPILLQENISIRKKLIEKNYFLMFFFRNIMLGNAACTSFSLWESKSYQLSHFCISSFKICENNRKKCLIIHLIEVTAMKFQAAVIFFYSHND